MARARSVPSLAPPRGRDELEFLATRQHSTPYTAETIEATLRSLARRARTFDGTSAGEAHDQGTELIELYARHADAVLGYRSFRALLRDRWGLGVATANQRMRLARATTREKAIEYGYTVCTLGLRLMKLTGAADFEELSRKKLPMPASAGGGFIQFPARADALRAAIREAKVRSDAKAIAALPRNMSAKLTEARVLLEQLTAQDDTIAALHPRAFVRDGRLHFPVRAPTDSAQLAAAARLYERLAKVLR